MKVRLTVEERDGKDTLVLRGEYHPGLPRKARELGGDWKRDLREWHFDPRDTDRVTDLLIDLYGHNGADSGEEATVDVHFNPYPFARYSNRIYAFGDVLCERQGRDDRVRLMDGVVVIEGGFPSSGGSARNPRLSAREGTILEVRDVPMTIYIQTRSKFADGVSLYKEEYTVDDIVWLAETEEEVSGPSWDITLSPDTADILRRLVEGSVTTPEEMIREALLFFKTHVEQGAE